MKPAEYSLLIENIVFLPAAILRGRRFEKQTRRYFCIASDVILRGLETQTAVIPDKIGRPGKYRAFSQFVLPTYLVLPA
jgi:hypothetical protein